MGEKHPSLDDRISHKPQQQGCGYENRKPLPICHCMRYGSSATRKMSDYAKTKNGCRRKVPDHAKAKVGYSRQREVPHHATT